ncbi:Hydantoinase [Methanosarcina thermophila CHTI-55]|uniref:Hydantoinase n=2 Tax=Methanosarcina thermophila TaxID=2210 RepID=A0A0E3NDW9_METTE|nr:Hydantoinase [Methanosarcina thermophila TM-1]AKB14776.1 Hydantoinase [Methanosarcina thermophila CHTI-55]
MSEQNRSLFFEIGATLLANMFEANFFCRFKVDIPVVLLGGPI